MPDDADSAARVLPAPAPLLDQHPISRRRFLALSASLGLGIVACSGSDPALDSVGAPPDRLRALPEPSARPPRAGLHPLGLSPVRDGLLYVPSTLRADQQAPLLVLLHGAGGRASQWFGGWGREAEERGLVLAVPDSREATWRMGRAGAGRDARFIDRMLASVFDQVSVDPERVAVAGFSDGASYALLLGLTNGDLFRRVVAFSPGFLASSPPLGRPRVFVSHGTGDTVLPIDRCSRVIVSLLRRAAYEVEYVEFAGGHEVPPAIRARAMDWLAG